jgi:hypothetical protein
MFHCFLISALHDAVVSRDDENEALVSELKLALLKYSDYHTRDITSILECPELVLSITTHITCILHTLENAYKKTSNSNIICSSRVSSLPGTYYSGLVTSDKLSFCRAMILHITGLSYQSVLNQQRPVPKTNQTSISQVSGKAIDVIRI